ncbi:hypothetical protein [Allorhizocola rhizosphaerae]|uniref:hypothetical protein n=1 Tax=Allorhizocola rhizosphaerae TaxID=1872709 RepID=UPI000E3B7590|nr:hypothetical protein [Allorhizocola rhizosphaerae]
MEDLVDAWEAAGIGAGYTYPTENPWARIDYIMQSSDVVAHTVAVLTDDLAGLEDFLRHEDQPRYPNA